MNSEELGFRAIGALFGAVALWGLWYCFWKDYALDKFRQDLFAIRDELFDDVASQSIPISFRSLAYGRMRGHVNFLIRQGFEINFSSVILVSLAMRIRGAKPAPPQPRPDPQMARYEMEYRRKVNVCILKYLAKASPTFVAFCLAVFLCVFVFSLAAYGWRNFKNLLVDTVDESLHTRELFGTAA